MAWTERPDDPGLYIIADTGEEENFSVMRIDGDAKTMKRFVERSGMIGDWWLRIPEPPVREGM